MPMKVGASLISWYCGQVWCARMLHARPGRRHHKATPVAVAVAAVLAIAAACWLFWNFEVKLVVRPRAAPARHGTSTSTPQQQPAAAALAAAAPPQAAPAAKGLRVDKVLGSYAATLEPVAQAARVVLATKASTDDVRNAYTLALEQYPLVGAFAAAPNPYTAAGSKDSAAAATAAAWELMTEGLRVIAANGRVVPCASDASMPVNITATSGRYLLAANLYNCDHMMANYVLQLMRVAVLFPHGSLAVSIYESGSTDHTADWVDLLRLLLLPLDVTATITPRGSLTKQHNQERIDFLAVVRNAALEPYFPPQHQQQQQCRSSSAARTPGCFRPDWILFLNDVLLCPSDVLRLMQYQDADMACGFDFYEPARRRHQRRSVLQSQQQQQQQQQQEEEEEEEEEERGSRQGSWQWQHQQLELWEHQQQGLWPQQQQQQYSQSTALVRDIDTDTFHDSAGSGVSWPQRQAPVEFISKQQQQQQQQQQHTLDVRLTAASTGPADSFTAVPWPPALQRRSQRRRALRAAAAAAAKPEERFLFLFWDIWVARDVVGHKFGGGSPYIPHAPTAERATAGLPFQVYCCWNGMVKLNPEPFRRGLRFRTAQAGECRASECSLMCDDFHRMGFNKAVVDPNVRLAYTLELKTKAYKRFPHLANTTWAQVSAAPHWHQHNSINYSTIECCNLQPGAHYVDYAKDCRAYDVIATNFTAQVLPQQHTGSAGGILGAGWAGGGGQRRSWTGLAVVMAGMLIVGGFAAWLHLT